MEKGEREWPREGEEERGLCGDGTIRYFDALQMATTFFLAGGRERRAALARSLAGAAEARPSTMQTFIPLKGRRSRRSFATSSSPPLVNAKRWPQLPRGKGRESHDHPGILGFVA